MNRIYGITLAILLSVTAIHAQSQEKTVTITTNVGTMKAR